METARGSYETCRERARKYRMAAGRCAREGMRFLAIYFTSRAQEYDDRAQEWRKHVPDWQWKFDWDKL